MHLSGCPSCCLYRAPFLLSVSVYRCEQVHSVSFSPSGEFFGSAGADSRVDVWLAANNMLLKQMTGHKADVLTIDYSRSNWQLASGSADSNIIIWDLDGENGSALLTLSGHTGPVRDVEVCCIRVNSSHAGHIKGASSMRTHTRAGYLRGCSTHRTPG